VDSGYSEDRETTTMLHKIKKQKKAVKDTYTCWWKHQRAQMETDQLADNNGDGSMISVIELG